MADHAPGPSAPKSDMLLYVRASCPYCQKVLAHLQARGLQVPQRDIGLDPAAREALIAVGGRGQVPCLVLDGRPMYESDRIVAYFTPQAERT